MKDVGSLVCLCLFVFDKEGTISWQCPHFCDAGENGEMLRWFFGEMLFSFTRGKTTFRPRRQVLLKIALFLHCGVSGGTR